MTNGSLASGHISDDGYFPFSRPVPLNKTHDTTRFDCGKEPLNTFLKRFALPNQAGGSSRTYVLKTEASRVIGFYSLAPSSITVENVPERVAKGQPRHPIPVILMTRFAVGQAFQGQGLGRALLFDALNRAVHASDEIGGRAFTVHAKDEEAAAFYRRFGMEASPQNPHHLYLLFKDVRLLLIPE